MSAPAQPPREPVTSVDKRFHIPQERGNNGGVLGDSSGDGLEAVAHKESWKVYSISLVSKLYITKQVFDCTLVSAVLQAINALSSHIQSIAFVQLLHHFTLSNGVFSELVVERNSEETSLFEELNMSDWYDLILVENLLPELKRQLQRLTQYTHHLFMGI